MPSNKLLTAYKNIVGLLLAINSVIYMLVFTLSWGTMPGVLSILYVGAEILFMTLALLSLGLTLLPKNREIHRQETKLPVHLGKRLGGISAVAILIPALVAFISGHTSVTLVLVHGCFAAAFGLSISLLAFHQPNPADVSSLARPVYPIYIALAGLFWINILLRWLVPDTFLLTWVIAPLSFFVVPGLSLAPALLPATSSWHEWLAYAPPLSIGTQIMCLIWLDFLGISVYTATFFAVAAVISLVGFALFFYRFLIRGSSHNSLSNY